MRALLACGTAFLTLAVFQESQPRRLPAPNGSLAEEFQNIAAVRELSDGRILLTDSRERRLVVADLRAGSVRQVGVAGEGPGEYRSAVTLIAGGSDTTFMPDVARNRWLVLHGSQIVQTVMSTPATELLARSAGSGINGADASAWLMNAKVPPPPRPPYEIGARDSIAVLRFARGTARIDTVTSIRRFPFKRVPLPGFTETDQQVTTISVAWSYGEHALMCVDGWVAAIRIEPYRIDWRSPAGQWSRGQAIAHARLPVTEREKSSYMTRFTAGRGPTNPTLNPPPEWPLTIPPIAASGHVCASDGRLFVHRSITAERQYPMYDIVDRRGVVAERLALAANERLVGFGPRSLYIAWKDSVDIERLRRHPYPW